MARKVWIEAALNGPWGKALQPGIPADPDTIIAEGIACAEAGAAIIHVHAYETPSAPQTFDWQVYARIIEGIRAKIDVPVYPSIPSAAIGQGPDTSDPATRFSHTRELTARGLLEWAVIDPGSVNFITVATRGDGPVNVYLNPEDHIATGLRLAAEFGFHPSYAIYEPGFTRAGARLAAAIPGVSAPVYRFMFSDGFAWGFPPRDWALAAHVRLLEECAPGAVWMIGGLDVDIRPLVAAAVATGGHVRVGLEDAPLGSTIGNVAWVEEAVRLVRAAGGEPATAADVRAALRSAQPPR
jgi:3-keto-5-aminohexanoate cleavage enzyme